MGLAVSSACSDSNISTPSSKVEGRLPRHAAGRDRSPLASKRRSSPREPSDFRNSESARSQFAWISSVWPAHKDPDMMEGGKPRRGRPPTTRSVFEQCGGGIRGLLRRESRPYDLLARTRRQVEAVGHVAASSHSHPFDTPLRAYSGQAVDLQEATSEPGIRVAEYCLVINHLFLWPWGDRQRSKVMLWVTESRKDSRYLFCPL